MDKYLELFDPMVVNDLFSIINSCSDNHKKADMVVEYLKPFKFKEIDLGTNIICMENKKYDNIVFKIALDSCGVEDNFNDIWLSEEIPEYSRVYSCHRTGIVSVHQWYKVFKTEQSIQRYHRRIMKLLKRLSKEYLIVDLSPVNIKNFGTDKKGNLVIVDGSDLIKLTLGVSEFRCTELVNKKNSKFRECGGELEYDDMFKYLVCKKCGKSINPLSLKKIYSREVNILKAKHFTIGITESQKNALDNYILGKRETQSNNSSESYDADEEIEDEVEMGESRTSIECEVMERHASEAFDVSNINDSNGAVNRSETLRQAIEKRKMEEELDDDDDCDDVVYQKNDNKSNDTHSDWSDDGEISDDRIHLMDNEWWVSYVTDEDTDEIDIILSKNKGNSWVSIYKVSDPDIVLSVTISSCKNIIYVFVQRSLVEGIVNELTKLDPTKFIADDIDQDEDYNRSTYIADCNDQIKVSLSPKNLSIDIDVDGDISILTRSNIDIRVSSAHTDDIEITSPELFELINSKL